MRATMISVSALLRQLLRDDSGGGLLCFTTDSPFCGSCAADSFPVSVAWVKKAFVPQAHHPRVLGRIQLLRDAARTEFCVQFIPSRRVKLRLAGLGRQPAWKKLLGPSFKDGALTGIIKVERVAGKSAATRAFAKYPLKFLLPNKIVSASVDAVWIFAISYGGGIVSNDSISQRVEIGPSCSAVITTQASTKIFKSVKGKFCEQILQAHVGREGFLAVLPDPITCFKDSKYTQVQEFYLAADANLVLIDWMTSGRVDNGESWEFELYKSTNHIYLEDVNADSTKSTPLFLDCLCLEQGVGISVAERMRGFHVIANMVIYGPKLRTFRDKVQKKVLELTHRAFTRRKSADLTARLRHSAISSEPLLFVSCSSIGLTDEGLVVRAVASTTELMYDFFKEQLAHIAPEIGACPYAGR